MARRIIWFGTKASILGAAIYYTNEIGVWGDSAQSTKLLQDVTNFITPYVRQNAPAQIKPDSLPTMAEISASTKMNWNKCVNKSTIFLSTIPDKSVELINYGVQFVNEQLQQQTEVSKE